MYHQNYPPPNGPPHPQATGGYANIPHYSAQQSNLPPSSVNQMNQQQMPYPQMHGQMMSNIPPHYPTQTAPVKMMSNLPNMPQSSNAQAQQMSESMKQHQQQMYMRPPMMSQSGGKPNSYNQQSIPYPHQMPPGHQLANSPHHLPMHQPPYHYNHPSQQYAGMPQSASPQQQYNQNPYSPYDVHMRQQQPPNSYPYNYPPHQQPLSNGVPQIYPNSTNRQMIPNSSLAQSQPSTDNLSKSQNEKSNVPATDERSETPKATKSHKSISHSKTPILGSPGAVSLSSSLHGEESENLLSPRTPASPCTASENTTSSKSSKKTDSFLKLYELGDEPERKAFLDKFIPFNEKRGSNIQCPLFKKQPIDLYKFYSAVRERGGFEEVITNKKKWREVINYAMDREVCGPLATLKRHYIEHLLPYECKFDLGNIDPKKLIEKYDPPKEKKLDKKSSNNKNAPSPCAVDSNSQSSYPQATTPLSSDNSNLSNLSSSNKSSQQSSNAATNNTTTNGQQSSTTISQRSATPTSLKDANHSSSNEINKFSNNNANLPSTPIPKQQPPFNPNVSLNNQKLTPPGYSSGSPQQMPFRPFSNDPHHSAGPHHPIISPNDNQQPPLNTNNLSHNEPYHLNSAEHYQNISRTHSPLAQRLMQQKSPVPSGYPSNQSPTSYNMPPNNLTPNKQIQTDQASNLNNSFVANKRPMPPVSPNQMMYSHQQQTPNMPPQFHSPYPPASHHFRPPYDQNTAPQWNDPNYGKIPNYNNQPTSIANQVPGAPSYSNQQINQMHPPIPPIPHSTQQMPHPPNIPPQGKPQYLLNLLANSNAPTSSSPNNIQQQQSQQNLPINQPLQPASQIVTQQQQKMQIPSSPNQKQQPQTGQLVASISQPQSNYVQTQQIVQSQQQIDSNLQTKVCMFPPNSIESVQPVLMKRKKITSKDINQVEAWRLMMSLKSGLLAESTWALDVLSILIHDDNTYLYFNLQKLPGLLDILLEYYKHYLTEIFPNLFENDGPIDESERPIKNRIDNNSPILDKQFECETIRRIRKRFNSENENDDDDQENNETSIKNNSETFSKTKRKKELTVNSDLLNDLKNENQFKQFILSPKNDYTFVTRTGKQVKIDPNDNLFVADFEKQWDVEDNKNAKLKNENRQYFSKGYGSITNYIQKHFEVGESCLKFARNLDKKYEEYEKSTKNDVNNDKENLISNNHPLTNDNDEDDEDKVNITYPRFRDEKPKSINLNNLENEAYKRDQPPLCDLNDYNETISRRCICISTLIRNMSFVKGNEVEFSKYKDLLFILGKLLLLHHEHLEKKFKPKTSNLEQLEQTLFNEIENTETTEQLNNLTKKTIQSESCETLDYLLKDEWWSDTVYFIRENTLVTLANISGKLNLSKFAECISLNILDGIIHWTVCKSSDAQDHLPSTSLVHLSPKRLSLECLAKLSILDGNIDLILSTPPWERMLQLFKCLAEYLSRDQEQTLREFALVLIHNLAISDTSIARAIALSSDCIMQLINFIEFAEQKALEVFNQQGFEVIKNNFELTGTTIEMVKRAAASLGCLARIPENRPSFFNYQQRLIALLMSPVLHPNITNIIADILYESSMDPFSKVDQTTSLNSRKDDNSNCLMINN